MRLLFVRHAEPDYVNDALTPKGHVEAELLSRRLSQLDVKDFYSSPLGRARLTAQYTLDKAGRSAQVLPWLAEFRGHITDEKTGKVRIPWDFMPRDWANESLFYEKAKWLDAPMMQTGNAAQIYQETSIGIDEVLAEHGYHRQDMIYRCENNNSSTLVFFCHFGISMAILSHLCGISAVALWQCFCAQPSSVTTVITEERAPGEVFFRCMQLGDTSHLYAGDEPWSTAGLFSECYTGIDTTDPNDPRFKK